MPFRPGLPREVTQQPPRLFVHIPKTAGTSFRAAAESRLGDQRVLRDYGPEAAATSRSVIQHVYGGGKPHDIQAAIDAQQALLITGHVPLNKYGRLIGLKNTVTIFRDPVEQVISHYRHATAHHNYQGSLLEFAQRKGIRNIQTRFLSGLDPALVGLVGLTERYRDTLKLINAQWRWRLRHHRKNVSDRFDREKSAISAEERVKLEALNVEDRILYRRATLVFENSLNCLRQGQQSDPRGALDPVEIGKTVRGWAFDMHSENKVSIELLKNGQRIGRANCEQPVAELKQWKIPRQGHVGFEFDLKLEPGDRLELKDVETGLTLDALQAG